MKHKITAIICAGLVSLVLFVPGWSAVTVDWDDVQQTIEGFGAATGDSRWSTITVVHARKIFSETLGAGVSLVRTGIAPDNTYPENTATKNAIAQGAVPWAAPWSPPASMKSNNSLWGGYLLPEYYQAYADYLRDWIIHQNNAGIRIRALSIQNEPDHTASGNQYTCGWTAQAFHDFILVLGPTLKAAGLGSVRIMLPEPGSWDYIPKYTDPTLNDPASAAYVGIVAGHAYSGTIAPYPNGQDKGKSLWQTEFSRFRVPFDPSIDNALNLALQIHKYMTIAQVNAYNYWLATHSADLDQELIWRSPNGDIVSKSLWAMGNFSKFVRPGWVRIGATANPASRVYISVYKEESSGKFAVVAINKNSSASPQSFVLNGTTGSSVTPWITSADYDLIAQPAMTVNGSAFDYTLPALSVVTLVGTEGTAEKEPVSLPFTMNCGPASPAVSGWTDDGGYMTSGDDYSTDADFVTTGVADAAPADLYKTCSRDEPVFAVPVDNGTYTVRLHFAEPAKATVAEADEARHMTVQVEGVTVLSDFSPAGAAGAVKTAYVHTVQTTVSDGSLDIQLQNGSGNDSFIMGLEVIAGGIGIRDGRSAAGDAPSPVRISRNPVHGGVYIGLDGSRGWQSCHIMNTSGKMVRHLQGTGPVYWDRKNELGGTVEPGIYFVTVAAGGTVAAGTITVME